MKFKLDENLGTSAIRRFRDAEHDTSSVYLQKLDGAPDDHVFEICAAEQRVLVTLDLDFANPMAFDPRRTSGVAVLRLSRSPAPSELAAAIDTLLRALADHCSHDREESLDHPRRARPRLATAGRLVRSRPLFHQSA